MEEKIKLIEEAIATLSCAVNVLGGRSDILAKKISEEIQKQHRTIQQSIWRTIFSSMRYYAEASYDDRNSASVNITGFVAGLMNDDSENFYFPYI